MKHLQKLLGHSGCQLNLYKDNGSFFLRKDAGNISYNYRLKKQCAKQKWFKLDAIKTPKVLRYGYDGSNLFYFDMEFINGISMSEYMNQIKIKEIVDLIELLFKSLPIKQSVVTDKSESIFKEKILSLYKTCDINNKLILKSLNKLKEFNFQNVPLCACCGDLTLENIILSSSGIYVIDLLDSFYNSWMIDVAKLLQDIDLGWSYRHQKRNYNLNLRLATAKQALLNNLYAMENGKWNVITIYHILLLNVLRIYPYAKDQTTILFLNNALESILNSINEMEA
ncbi:hypothetical protein [Campylobacter lanienae]|uniref:hypothetical protein n=1 Tax=Campylobacter lanienae TaxID=75658 RepID=UPI000BB41B85|nr:hypothetical protein [Campylobacter lanienae]